MKNKMFKITASFILLVFTINTALPVQVYGQVLNLPQVGQMVKPTPQYIPAIIKGIKIFPDNPLRFDFIVDTGDTRLEGDALKQESEKLIKYFLASLTTPEEDIWVNLSPYEKDRIIPNSFGQTEMGRDLLAQDYILKQLTASLMYPEDELGETFWDQIFEKAYEMYGTTDIPINTFNKVWIMPEKAVVYENEDTAFVVESRLKVMLEEDYLAMEKNNVGANGIRPNQISSNKGRSPIAPTKNNFQTQIIRNVILPAIEKEVNQGKHFANLRQIYHALILATWFKMNLKESLLGQIYVDQNKIAGVDIEDKNEKQKIYDQYIEAFKEGVYDYIRDDFEPATQQIIPRKYFSGGFKTKFTIDNISFIGEEPGSSVLDYVKSGSSPVVQVNIEVKKAFLENSSDGNQVQNKIEGLNVDTSSKRRKPIFQLSRKKYEPIFNEINGHLQGKNPIFGILSVPGAGKTTLSKNFASYLEEKGVSTAVIHTDWFINKGVGKFRIIRRMKHLINQALFNIPFLLPEGEEYYLKHFVNSDAINEFFGKVESFRNSDKESIEIEVITSDGIELVELKKESVIIVEGTTSDILTKGVKNRNILFIQTNLEDARNQMINRDSGEGKISEIEWILKSFLFISRGRYKGFINNINDYDFVLDVRNKSDPILKVKGGSSPIKLQTKFNIQTAILSSDVSLDQIERVEQNPNVHMININDPSSQQVESLSDYFYKPSGITYDLALPILQGGESVDDAMERYYNHYKAKKVKRLKSGVEEIYRQLGSSQVEIVEDHFGHNVSDMQQFLNLYSSNMADKLHGEDILKDIVSQIGLRAYMKQVSGIYLKKDGKVIGGFLVRELEGKYSLPFIALDSTSGIGDSNMYFFLLQHIMKRSIKKEYKVLNARLDENLYGYTLSAGVANAKARLGFKPVIVDQRINPDIGRELMKITNFDNFMMPVFFYNFGEDNTLESTLIVDESTKGRVNEFKGITNKLNIYEVKGDQIVPLSVAGSPVKIEPRSIHVITPNGEQGVTIGQERESFEIPVIDVMLSDGEIKAFPVGLLKEVLTSSPVQGGIDFNPNNLNIETQGNGINYNAPIDPQLLESLTSSPIEGFSPVIFNITPILNLPKLLGLSEQNEEPLQQSKLPTEEIYLPKYWQEEIEV